MRTEPRLPRKILVVDDDLDIAAPLATLLRDMGHQVEFAINGGSALLVAWRLQPELIFLDVGPPDIDGWELARDLRGCPGRSAAVGCQRHLVKPVDLKVVESLFATGRTPAAA